MVLNNFCEFYYGYELCSYTVRGEKMNQEEPKVIGIFDESIDNGDYIDVSNCEETPCDCHCDSSTCEQCCMD